MRASAAIPFLFPSVRIGEHYYVDGGLRMNTPLSPALRLGADRVLVIALKHEPGLLGHAGAYPEDVVTQPAFVLGKVLNALLLDQLEYELQRIDLVNAWIEHGRKVYGADFLEHMNPAVRQQRGADYRHVRVATIRPGRDIGEMADDCYHQRVREKSLGSMRFMARLALRGVPRGEADLLSYLFLRRLLHQPARRAGPRRRPRQRGRDRRAADRLSAAPQPVGGALASISFCSASSFSRTSSGRCTPDEPV